MTRHRSRISVLLTIVAGSFVAAPAQAGSWQNSYGFGATLKGDLYTPTTLGSPPAILVAIHMCTGHSSTVHGWFDSYADKTGFYIIAPDAGKQCFDASASRDGDKAAIVTMVNYLITNKGADKTRVFAAGMSSGGCMTNTLLAVYPDVFAGGSAMPGFPAGGWPAGDTTCTKCSSQPPSTDGKYWGDIARKAFSWSGTYGCSQQWVGGGDEYNFNGWLPAVAAQFQNLSNLSAGTSASGRSGWTRTVYKNSDGNVRLETNLGPSSQKHDLETVSPTLYGDVVTFLGLDKTSGACGLSGSTGGGGSGGGDAGPAPGTGGAGGGRDAGSVSGDAVRPGTGGGAGNAGGSTGSSGSGGTTVVAQGTGGSVGSGGSENGGSKGTGGSNGSGGSSASAGSGGSGGSSASAGSGGSTGSNGTGGSTSKGGGSSGGCVIGARVGHSTDTLAALLLVGVALILRRRQRSGR